MINHGPKFKYHKDYTFELIEENKPIEEPKHKTAIQQIAKLISSGEIPKKVYDKYLSGTLIGFMSYDDLMDYLMMACSKSNTQTEEPKLPIKLGEYTTTYTCSNLDFAMIKLINEVIKNQNQLIDYLSKGDEKSE